jgi:DNA-binding IclR family transcriptional regulator
MKPDVGQLIHDKEVMSSTEGTHSWTFLSNHAQVLLCIARDPEMRIRDIAQSVGITERAAQRIVVDLDEAGYVEREKVGRRNHYRLNGEVRMRHVAQADYEISELLKAFQSPTESPGGSP